MDEKLLNEHLSTFSTWAIVDKYAAHVEKSWENQGIHEDKKYFFVENSVESVTNRCISVTFGPFCAKKGGFCKPYIVLTYWEQHNIMLSVAKIDPCILGF
ncbi:MAG: hypothetical protein PUD16_06060 [bacterium]|nr:hypothetical protein [bacterium]